MADEVVIRLQAQSAQLEASISRLEQSLHRLDNRARQANTSMQTGAQRTSKSINDQNKSFTLMVAKLALVTFAVQTLANIFQNTFGAILKTIDDFEIAAIGAAAAVTGITSETERPIGDVFNQNLEATKQLFEQLELTAAKYFSTGQELQLAWNTLAQRGVVIREEEFDILGKLTDQIKLLTGGQNSQIQIQQELRAILDGNVRTTTAFGKALQARGVDIAQLSREVRATGSIQVFEQFLTGLDAASGSIRRTLTSVLTTFSSLFNILSRNIFQDTYDEVVAQITRVNNFIIDQREELIRVGRTIVDKVKGGFDLVLGVVKEIVDLISDIGSTGLGQILIFFRVLSTMAAGPLRSILLIGGVIFALTGDFKAVANAAEIFVKALRIGFNILEKGLGSLTNFSELLRNLELTLRGFQNVNLVNQEQEIEQKLAGMSPEERASDRGRFFEQQLVQVRQKILNNIQAIEKEVSEGGEEAGTSFIDGLGAGISEGLEGLNLQLDKKIEELGIVDTEDRIKKVFDDLLAQSKALEQKPKVGLADTKDPFLFDTTSLKAGLKNAEEIQRQTLANIDKIRAQASEQETRRIKLELAERKITGLEAFNAEVALNQRRQQDNLKALEVRKKQIQDEAEAQRQILAIDAAVDEGPNKLTELEAQQRSAEIFTKERTDLLRIEQQISAVRAEIDNTALDVAKQITEETRKVNRLLEDRAFELARVGGFTNQERATQFGVESDRAKSDFAAQNVGNQEAIDIFNAQQDRKDFLRLVQPQIDAFTNAVEQTFNTLIDGVVEGSFRFKDLANTLSKDLIKSGLQDLIEQAKDAVVEGMESLFSGFSDVAAQQAAQALAVGIGLLLAVLSRVGNDGDFTATGGAGGGTGIQSSRQVRGIIGGDTSIPIAEINNGLMEALIPTNALLTQIERNTRATAAASLDLDPAALQDALNNSLNQIFQQAILQNGTP